MSSLSGFLFSFAAKICQMKKTYLVLSIVLLAVLSSFAQQESVDSAALFLPKLKSELPDEVNETSGLFFHNGLLWTHNDSGGKPILYGIDTTTFEVVQKITLLDVKNKDWEDVCTDGEFVYVGDFGNNKGNRKNLRIYVFPLSDIPSEGNASVTVDTISFRFADQVDFEKRKLMTDFDCESIFATSEYLYMFSKCWVTGTARLYRLPKTPGNYVAEVVNAFDSQGLITGADYDEASGTLVLLGYVKTLWKPFMYLIYNFDEHGTNLASHRFEFPQLIGCQTEGVCFYDDGRCFVSAETSPTFTARVFEVDFRKWMNENRKK